MDPLADSLFQQTFCRPPTIGSIAPGRVNLIGEHTDYNDGFVFPAAIDKEVHVAATEADQESQLVSAQVGPGINFDALTVEPGQVNGWAAYAAGMAWALRMHTGMPMPNIRAAVASTVPMGSGVSSSAAMELAFGTLWVRLAGLEIDNKTLAKIAQRCENEFVGVNCGIMDQMASAMGRAGQAIFVDTRSLDLEYAPIPNGLALVLCDTKRPRALSDSAYNERRSQCEEACRILGVATLRDADMDTLILNRDRMDDVIYRRARHVVSENARAVDFKAALQAGNLATIGILMTESHVSLRDDYEVSCPELDAMAESCWDAPGCVGARMTGAGFGGACIALVDSDLAQTFIDSVSGQYEGRINICGEYTICHAADGARAIPL